jgi:hypothetical protein
MRPSRRKAAATEMATATTMAARSERGEGRGYGMI